ncbi:MAG: hypothetical protein IPJ37_01965 [Bacteroidales bacterium]|nr:hypothetical protein [Bacteroidales bacterium]
MTTVEIRHNISEKLSQIDDISFLKAIMTIVESKVKEDTYKLSDFQKERIESGREQKKKGQTISDSALQKDVRQWLSSK